MEIEVITSGPEAEGSEEHRPLGCEGLGSIEHPLEELRGPLARIEETPDVKAKPKRSARPKAVRFEAARGGEASGRDVRLKTPSVSAAQAALLQSLKSRPSPDLKRVLALVQKKKKR